MKISQNKFRDALKAGQNQIGLWVGLADANVAEALAGTGFDWLLLDAEHAPNNVRTLLEQLRAVAPYPVHPIVRPVEGEVSLIKQCLDVGAQTLLVPMIDTPEQACCHSKFKSHCTSRGRGWRVLWPCRSLRLHGASGTANSPRGCENHLGGHHHRARCRQSRWHFDGRPQDGPNVFGRRRAIRGGGRGHHLAGARGHRFGGRLQRKQVGPFGGCKPTGVLNLGALLVVSPNHLP